MILIKVSKQTRDEGSRPPHKQISRQRPSLVVPFSRCAPLSSSLGNDGYAPR